MNRSSALLATFRRLHLAAWLPPAALAASTVTKAVAAAVILIVPGLLTLCVVYLVARRFRLRRRAAT
jgi:hypothetical protein